MIVNHIIPRFPYFNENTVVGGSANALYNLIKQQNGIIEHRILANIPYKYDGRAPIDIIPLNINLAPTTRQFGLLFTYLIAKESLKKDQPVDLVHGHSGHFDYTLATSIYAAIKKIPAIHSIYCPLNSNNLSQKILQRMVLSLADPSIDTYIAVSNNVANSLYEAGIAREKINVIPPIVDLGRFKLVEDNAKSKEKLGLNPKTPIILFVGSTKPVKNLETVLEAFTLVLQEIPDAKLIITTELEHAEHEKRSLMLMDIIRKNNISDKIIQIGIVDSIPEMMAASDVLVAPFLDTNGPSDYFQAVLEAMAVGRPVVVSSVGGMAEIVDDQVGFLTDPKDASGMASAIIKILSDTDLRIILGRTASSKIQTKHDPNTIEQKIRSLYLSLVS